jgi:hypothetical protein
VFHCLTVSLAYGGEGLGTAWGEQLARQLLADAEFSRVTRRRWTATRSTSTTSPDAAADAALSRFPIDGHAAVGVDSPQDPVRAVEVHQ